MIKIFIRNTTILFGVFFLLNHSIVNARIVDTIEALNDKTIGIESAPIKMVEFASLTCGHCATFHNEVFPKLKKNTLKVEKFFLPTKIFH